MFSLVFGSVFFEVAGNDDGEVKFEGFLFPAIAGAEVGESYYFFAVAQDVEFGGFAFGEAAGGEPDITGEFCLLLLAKEPDYENLSLHSFGDTVHFSKKCSQVNGLQARHSYC
jgi:hypothetical protein